MLRKGFNALLLILLLVNLWLAAAVAGKFGPEPLAGWAESPREPQRLGQQARVERMQIQPPRAAEAADAAVAPASSPAAPRAAHPAAISSTARTSADSCMEVGGFTAQNVQRAIEDLKAIAVTAPLPMEQFERSEQVRWWVHLPAQPTRENADRKLAELRYGGDVLQDCRPVTQARGEPVATRAEG